jgi:hypothetical protein
MMCAPDDATEVAKSLASAHEKPIHSCKNPGLKDQRDGEGAHPRARGTRLTDDSLTQAVLDSGDNEIGVELAQAHCLGLSKQRPARGITQDRAFHVLDDGGHQGLNMICAAVPAPDCGWQGTMRWRSIGNNILPRGKLRQRSVELHRIMSKRVTQMSGLASILFAVGNQLRQSSICSMNPN